MCAVRQRKEREQAREFLVRRDRVGQRLRVRELDRGADLLLACVSTGLSPASAWV